MLSATEREETDQEVAAFMAEFDHMFGDHNEGILNDDASKSGTSSDDTSANETNTQGTKKGTQEDASFEKSSVRRDRFAHLSPELASHARAIERYNFLKSHCPWSQDEAFLNMMCSLHNHPQTMGLPPSSTEPLADESPEKDEGTSLRESQTDVHAETK
ncbi:hypothetical protein FVEG_00401 [Fusarium verticillioides 7600]|uniref:Uncharacterized protein n=1 Tax=Gibberella moniliformis (strain M3125 / FGSC 7600) TaxID=334819 RepID=W7LCL8_GIBM7|nr:hypothetical protein FVEG_00401 [Fusarium verticillioides 7600]EWG36321.1 hypothetical protein FVEG_00401 [Fusarium verticillioides 7600]RBQ69065.1 hypothetical protein FVER14953_00401 [Fusarium verticillioides]RBQ84114.1 hypothetical protein FVER53263_00401 [Fusarium verticillioides]